MHIPDGYLSPSTCALLYGGAFPFWYASCVRLKRRLSTRMVPLVAVTSAFCFVIMMFNIPLPGGTTGHAVGVGASAVALGPWGSMLAVSVALLVQALFFGDGGITTLGANCFNMAIVGSLAAHLVYRGVAGKSAVTSRRRVLAASLSGYAAINVSALLAAIELGIQPLLFKDAGGAPLYAPYSLRVAVPAMMIGHLTLGGLADFFVSGGVVAYLQRANPAVLTAAGPGAGEAERGVSRGGWALARPLWIRLAVVMLLTPLGILAAGKAWGEWSAADFARPEMRAQMAIASRHVMPPMEAPKGLARLSSVWTAPFPQYAPRFVRHPGFGYALSAAFGGGLILLTAAFLSRLAAAQRAAGHPPARSRDRAA